MANDTKWKTWLQKNAWSFKSIPLFMDANKFDL
jgi:hypothetical protein